MRSRASRTSLALLLALVAALALAGGAAAQTVQPSVHLRESSVPGCDASAQHVSAHCEKKMQTACDAGETTGELGDWCKMMRDRQATRCKEGDVPATGELADECELLRRRHDEAQQRAEKATQPDPTVAMGRTPSCKRADISPEAAQRCRSSGNIYRTYPLSSYGLDNGVDPSFTDASANMSAALQTIASLIWTALLWALEGVFVLLDWAFNLDPLSKALPQVSERMTILHEDVLGKPMTLAAFAGAGAWGVWHGLVRQRAGETLGGLLATVLLMIIALWMIHDPKPTVGVVGKTSNDAALAVLGVTSGDPSSPHTAYSDQQGRIYDELVTKPWCMLQFGDVKYCDQTAKDGRGTNRDLWLSFAAQGPERRAFYRELTGDKGTGLDATDVAATALSPAGGAALHWLRQQFGSDADAKKVAQAKIAKDPRHGALQGKYGAIIRLGLLLLVALGLIGAIVVLLRIAIHLMGAAVMALLLLLLAPVMLFVPAFGEGGRRGFGIWIKRLLGALATKFIYAFVLTVVLVLAGIIWSLSTNWFTTWLFMIAFWWGLAAKMSMLIGLITLEGAGGRGGAGGTDPLGAMTRAYFAMRSARELGSMALGAVRAPASKAARLARLDKASRLARVQGQEAVIRGSENTKIARRIFAGRQADLDRARKVLNRGQMLEANVNEGRAKQAAYDREYKTQLWGDDEYLELSRNNAADLATAQEQLSAFRASEETKWANSIVSRYGSPDGIPQATERDIDDWKDRRARDVALWQASSSNWSTLNNLRAAGVDPSDFSKASKAGDGRALDAMRKRVEQTLVNDQMTIERSSGQPLAPTVRKQALKEQVVPAGENRWRDTGRHGRAVATREARAKQERQRAESRMRRGG